MLTHRLHSLCNNSSLPHLLHLYPSPLPFPSSPSHPLQPSYFFSLIYPPLIRLSILLKFYSQESHFSFTTNLENYSSIQVTIPPSKIFGFLVTLLPQNQI
ncbi:hypothetical protein ACH5RR_014874 [Cinchona calisaya]|uniref:Uncharacterized protein n=1 Tax=Cinchona calisaya TaxID=153742 RepID=A0ABD2ZUM3_9GENT